MVLGISSWNNVVEEGLKKATYSICGESRDQSSDKSTTAGKTGQELLLFPAEIMAQISMEYNKSA